MLPTLPRPTSRPLNLWIGLGIPAVIAIALCLLELTDIDMVIEQWFYDPVQQAFAGRHSYWLENVLHDQAKRVVIAIGVLGALGYLASFLVKGLLPIRRELACLVVAMSLSTSYTAPLKALTGVQCPWSVTEFGGTQAYSKLFEHRPATSSPGRCWPGGHAATGFTLFSLFFVLRDRRPRMARAGLVFAFGLGTVFSIGRMIQGAHFLSHNIWAAIFCWLICLGTYYVMLYRPQAATDTLPQAAPATA
ncbi:phosphatase PAP2 family protein [Pseudomonas sp. App30]|uniref:phosphatase PAP2 family protein n=1 Tax=Pseudomonas sp. App30 TaxID=3068990 RepID=UPI003A8130A2